MTVQVRHDFFKFVAIFSSSEKIDKNSMLKLYKLQKNQSKVVQVNQKTESFSRKILPKIANFYNFQNICIGFFATRKTFTFIFTCNF